MLVVDDLLLRPIVGFVELLHDMALRELHDVEEIRDEIKENRLLYEIGERSESAYQRRKAELEERLAVAEEAREHLRGRAEVIR